MPYVKSIPIRATVNKSLNYILNPDKTEGLVYVSSMNCMTSAKDAYLEMKAVFESFSTEKFDAPLPLEGKESMKMVIENNSTTVILLLTTSILMDMSYADWLTMLRIKRSALA